jgi:hypothetical protein
MLHGDGVATDILGVTRLHNQARTARAAPTSPEPITGQPFDATHSRPEQAQEQSAEATRTADLLSRLLSGPEGCQVRHTCAGSWGFYPPGTEAVEVHRGGGELVL